MANFNPDPFSERIECIFCDKICSHPAGLRSHVYHSHTKVLLDERDGTVIPASKRKIPKSPSSSAHSPKKEMAVHDCPLCDGPRMSIRQIEKHLTAVHGCDLAEHTMSFATSQDFQMWMLKYCAETCAEYVKHSVFYVRNKRLKVRPYVCQRNGHVSNVAAENANLVRQKKAIKINGYCPARISAYYRENGRVDIKYVKTHIGHDADVSLLREATVKYLKSKHLMVDSTDPTADRLLLLQLVEANNERAKRQTKTHSCVDCVFTHVDKKIMNEHLVTLHGYDLTQHIVDLADMDEFRLWMKQYTEETGSQYVLRTNTVTVNNGRNILYVCQRDGFSTLTGEEIRKVRRTSTKLNGYCPAYVAVKIEQDGTVRVTYLATHVHDPMPPKALNASNESLKPKVRRIRKRNKKDASDITVQPSLSEKLMTAIKLTAHNIQDTDDLNLLPFVHNVPVTVVAPARKKKLKRADDVEESEESRENEAKEKFIKRLRRLICKYDNYQLLENVVSVLEESLGSEEFVFFKIFKV